MAALSCRCQHHLECSSVHASPFDSVAQELPAANVSPKRMRSALTTRCDGESSPLPRCSRLRRNRSRLLGSACRSNTAAAESATRSVSSLSSACNTRNTAELTSNPCWRGRNCALSQHQLQRHLSLSSSITNLPHKASLQQRRQCLEDRGAFRERSTWPTARPAREEEARVTRLAVVACLHPTAGYRTTCSRSSATRSGQCNNTRPTPMIEALITTQSSSWRYDRRSSGSLELSSWRGNVVGQRNQTSQRHLTASCLTGIVLDCAHRNNMSTSSGADPAATSATLPSSCGHHCVSVMGSVGCPQYSGAPALRASGSRLRS